MKLTSLVNPQLVFLDRSFPDPGSLPDFLAREYGRVTDRPEAEIRQILKARQELGATFVGNACVLVHGRLEDFNDLVVGFIRLAPVLKVMADDREEEVRFVFSVLTSKHQNTQLYIKTLSSISRLVLEHSPFLDTVPTAEALLGGLAERQLFIESYLTARDLCSAVPSVLPEDPIARALDLMRKHSVVFLPVADREGRLAGAIGLIDLLRASLPEYVLHLNVFSFMPDFEPIRAFWENEHRILVRQVMRAPGTMAVLAGTGYAEVVFLIAKHFHGHLIVVDGGQRVLGVISNRDLINKLIRP